MVHRYIVLNSLKDGNRTKLLSDKLQDTQQSASSVDDAPDDPMQTDLEKTPEISEIVHNATSSINSTCVGPQFTDSFSKVVRDVIRYEMNFKDCQVFKTYK